MAAGRRQDAPAAQKQMESTMEAQHTGKLNTEYVEIGKREKKARRIKPLTEIAEYQTSLKKLLNREPITGKELGRLEVQILCETVQVSYLKAIKEPADGFTSISEDLYNEISRRQEWFDKKDRADYDGTIGIYDYCSHRFDLAKQTMDTAYAMFDSLTTCIVMRETDLMTQQEAVKAVLRQTSTQLLNNLALKSTGIEATGRKLSCYDFECEIIAKCFNMQGLLVFGFPFDIYCEQAAKYEEDIADLANKSSRFGEEVQRKALEGFPKIRSGILPNQNTKKEAESALKLETFGIGTRLMELTDIVENPNAVTTGGN